MDRPPRRAHLHSPFSVLQRRAHPTITEHPIAILAYRLGLSAEERVLAASGMGTSMDMARIGLDEEGGASE